VNACRHIAALGALLLLFSACQDARARGEKLVRRADLDRLRHDAAVVYKECFTTSGGDLVPLPQERWPASFKRFSPVRVNAYRTGIALVLTPSLDEERGIYIAPEGLDLKPIQSPRAAFHQVKPGVYWFEFGTPGK
jgi:hypothetical protein